MLKLKEHRLWFGFLGFLMSLFALNADAFDLSIVAVGDMMFGKELTPVLEGESPELPFAGTLEILRGADIAVSNLASSISTRGDAPIGRPNLFRSAPAAARSIAGSAIKVVSLANPHMMDYGSEALVDTLDFLSWYGIKSVGAGHNLKAAIAPAILELKGVKVAFLGYYHGAQFSSEYADIDKPGTAPAALSLIKQEVESAKKKSDIVVVFIHWGIASNPDSPMVSPKQQFLAQEAVNSGADLVLGQKLHTVQGLEIYSQKAILYSLGDFIFGTYDKKHLTSVIAKFSFTDKKLTRIQLVPILVANSDPKFQPKVLKGEEAKKALADFQQLCFELKTDVNLDGDFGYIDILPPSEPSGLKKSSEGDKER